jgi:hypothetical protein
VRHAADAPELKNLHSFVLRAALLQLPQLFHEFANGTFLTSRTMAWLGLLSARGGCARAGITASPLRPGLDELAGLPEAVVMVDENDVRSAVVNWRSTSWAR